MQEPELDLEIKRVSQLGQLPYIKQPKLGHAALGSRSQAGPRWGSSAFGQPGRSGRAAFFFVGGSHGPTKARTVRFAHVSGCHGLRCGRQVLEAPEQRGPEGGCAAGVNR